MHVTFQNGHLFNDCISLFHCSLWRFDSPTDKNLSITYKNNLGDDWGKCPRGKTQGGIPRGGELLEPCISIYHFWNGE